MKIKKEHFEKLETEIEKVLEKHGKETLISFYESGNFNGSEKVKDLQMRFCFDLLFATGLNSWVCDNLYSYLNDQNVYTALKAICPKVERKY